jgi:cell division protein FtsQ
MTSAVAVDPRFRARRIAVLRAAGRRRLWWILSAAAAVALVACAWFTTRTSLLDVDRIDVQGTSVTAPADITAALAMGPGTPMLDVDTGLLAARVEALPFVDEVTVTRHWPNRLEVTVTERAAVALALTAPDQWVEVDAEGRVLGPAGSDSTLPRLSGLHAAGEPGSFLAADATAPLELVGLSSGALDVQGVWRADGDLWLRLASGPVVRIGSGEDLGLKVVAAAALLEHLRQEAAVGGESEGPPAAARGALFEVDVSVPTAPAARTARSVAGMAEEQAQADAAAAEAEAAAAEAVNGGTVIP